MKTAKHSLPVFGTALTCLALLGGACSAPRVPVVADRFQAPADVVKVSWHKPLVRKLPFLYYKPQEFAAAAASTDLPEPLVFVGSSTGEFYALRQRDGAEVWHHKLSGAVASEPLYLPAGVAGPEPWVLVGDDDGALTALSARSGAVAWVYRVRGALRVRPAVDSVGEGDAEDGSGAPQPAKGAALVYFTSGEGRLYAVDLKTGAWRWQYDREVPESFTIRGGSGALATGGKVYAGFADGYLAVLKAQTGEVLWTQQISGDATRFTDVDSTPVLWRGTLYVSSYTGGVYALDAQSGQPRWRFELDGAGPLQVDRRRGRVYVAAAQSGVFCLDLAGRLLWRQGLAQQGELSQPTLLGRYLLVSAAGGGMYVANAETGALLQFFDPGQGASGRPVTSGRSVYLLSNAGVFFALHTG